MNTSRQWQLAHDAAEAYERVVVPTILGPFAKALVDWSHLQPGEEVLDLGCGTGAVARHAATVIGPTGRITGVDINPGMIAVAQSLPPASGAPITWKQQSVYDLTPTEILVDAVISSQAVQFFPDQHLALSTIRQVLKPGGRLTLSAWSGPEKNPYFRVQGDAVAGHLGDDAASGLHAGFSLANPEKIRSLLTGAGYTSVQIEAVEIFLTLPPLEAFIPQHFMATPLAAAFSAASAEQQQAIVDDIIARLDAYRQPDARVVVPFHTHMARGDA